MSSIMTYNLSDLTIQEIEDRIQKDEVFDIDKSLFSDKPGDILTNHFFDETTPVSFDIGGN